ncbi:hypothetical protein MHZ92_19965 [Sporosarcina sp. ACRSL]|uniref:hypothetical protein n=1 Tax=Sporosarcina sp. ACRSL TaxID=2918215 RepID=UPI001EF63D6A|nr:hypothetical protein [Sporosarcina sp. ACRSL]MCG7346385.1 hypothetical protein [Sporosarcina sp. ACRSL]
MKQRDIQIQRRYGPHGITRVIVWRDGEEYEFTVGRNVGERRIYELAQNMKLQKREI